MRGIELEHNVGKERANHSDMSSSDLSLEANNERIRTLSFEELGISRQLDHPGPPTGSKLHSVSVSDIEESMSNLHSEIGEFREGNSYRGRNKLKEEGSHEVDDFGEKLVDSLLFCHRTFVCQSSAYRHRNKRARQYARRVDADGDDRR